MSETEYKVDRETAEADFDQMCATMGVETDEDIMEQADREDFGKHRMRVIKAIMTGHVTVSGGVPSVQCGDETVTFQEPKGGAFLVPMKKGEDELRRMYKIAGQLTEGKAKMAQRSMPDYRVLLSLTSLFIAM
ncbi:hypothetical protein [Vibrio phage CKB-S1]|nr:hypothetical protein [Vibrio phage CKB-S1]